MTGLSVALIKSSLFPSNARLSSSGGTITVSLPIKRKTFSQVNPEDYITLCMINTHVYEAVVIKLLGAKPTVLLCHDIMENLFPVRICVQLLIKHTTCIIDWYSILFKISTNQQSLYIRRRPVTCIVASANGIV